MAVRKPPTVDFTPLLPPDPIEAALARKRAAASRQQLILRRQRILRAKGYLTSVDGNWGPVSQGAWKRYRSGQAPLASNGSPIPPPPVRVAPPSGALRRRAIDGVPDGATGSAAEAEATLKARQATAHARAMTQAATENARKIQEQAAKINRQTFLKRDPIFGTVPQLKKDLIPKAPPPDIRSVVQKRSDLAVLGMEATLTAGPSVALQEQEIRAHVAKILEKPITAWSTSDFALVYGTSYGIPDWWHKPNQVKRVQRYLINNYGSKGSYFQGFQPQTKSPVFGKDEGLRVTGEMDAATGKAMLAAMAIEKRKDFLQRAAVIRQMYYMPLGIHEGDPGFPMLGKAPSPRNLMKILDAGGWQASQILYGLSQQLKKADVGYTVFRDQMIDEALRGTKGGKLVSAQGVFASVRFVESDDPRVQAMQAVSTILVRAEMLGMEGGNVPGRRGDTYTDELLAIAHAPTREAMIQAIHDVRAKDTQLWQFEQAKKALDSHFWGDVFGATGKVLHGLGYPADQVADFYNVYVAGGFGGLGRGLTDMSLQRTRGIDYQQQWAYRAANQKLWEQAHPWTDMLEEAILDPLNLVPGAWFKAPFVASARTAALVERVGIRMVEAEQSGVGAVLLGQTLRAPVTAGRAVRLGGGTVKLTTAEVLGPTWVGAAKRGLTTTKAQMVHKTALLLDSMKANSFRKPTWAMSHDEKRMHEIAAKVIKDIHHSTPTGEVVAITDTFVENGVAFQRQMSLEASKILKTMLREGASLFAHVNRSAEHGSRGLTVFGSHFAATIASYMRGMMVQQYGELQGIKVYKEKLAEYTAQLQDNTSLEVFAEGNKDPTKTLTMKQIKSRAFSDGARAAAEARAKAGAYLYGGGDFMLDMMLEEQVQKRMDILMGSILPTLQDALEERMRMAGRFDNMFDAKTGIYIAGDSKLARMMTDVSRDMFDDLLLDHGFTVDDLLAGKGPDGELIKKELDERIAEIRAEGEEQVNQIKQSLRFSREEAEAAKVDPGSERAVLINKQNPKQVVVGKPDEDPEALLRRYVSETNGDKTDWFHATAAIGAKKRVESLHKFTDPVTGEVHVPDASPDSLTSKAIRDFKAATNVPRRGRGLSGRKTKGALAGKQVDETGQAVVSLDDDPDFVIASRIFQGGQDAGDAEMEALARLIPNPATRRRMLANRAAVKTKGLASYVKRRPSEPADVLGDAAAQEQRARRDRQLVRLMFLHDGPPSEDALAAFERLVPDEPTRTRMLRFQTEIRQSTERGQAKKSVSNTLRAVGMQDMSIERETKAAIDLARKDTSAKLDAAHAEARNEAGELADVRPRSTIEIDNVNFGKVFTQQEYSDIIKFQLARKTRSVQGWAQRRRLRGKPVAEGREEQIINRWIQEQNTEFWEKIDGGWTQRKEKIKVPAIYARHLDEAWGDALRGAHPELTAADVPADVKKILAMSAPPVVAAEHPEVVDIAQRLAASLTGTTYRAAVTFPKRELDDAGRVVVAGRQPVFGRNRPGELGISRETKRGSQVKAQARAIAQVGPDYRPVGTIKQMSGTWTQLAAEQNALLNIMQVHVQPHLFRYQWAGMLALSTAQSTPLKMLWGTIDPLLNIFSTAVIPLSPKTVFRNIVDNYLRILANGHFDPRFYVVRLPDEYRMGSKSLIPEVYFPEVYSLLGQARKVQNKYSSLYYTGQRSGQRFKVAGIGPSPEQIRSAPELSFAYAVQDSNNVWHWGKPGEKRSDVIERLHLEEGDDLASVHVQFHRGSGRTTTLKHKTDANAVATDITDPKFEKTIREKYDGVVQGPKGTSPRLEGKVLDLLDGDISEWPKLLEWAEGNPNNFNIVTVFSWGVRAMRHQLKVAMQNNPNAAIRILDEFDRHVNAIYAKDGEAIKKVFNLHDIPITDVSIRGQQYIGDGRNAVKQRGVLRLSDDTWAQLEGLNGTNADAWIAALHASEPITTHGGSGLRGDLSRTLGWDSAKPLAPSTLQREALRSFFAFQRDALWDTMVGIPEGTARATLYRAAYRKALQHHMGLAAIRAHPEIKSEQAAIDHWEKVTPMREKLLAKETAKIQADIAAVKEISSTLFDYDQVTVLEDNLRLLAPFMFYWRKTLPFWVKKMVRNPWIPADVQRFQQAHDQAGENKDVPDWMRRYWDMNWFTDAVAKVNGLNWLFPAFDDAKVGADPMNFWSGAIAYKLFKAENESMPADEQGVTFLADLIDQINATGLSFTPFFRKPLEWAGVLNYRAWQTAFPQTAVIEAWSRTHLKQEFPNGFNLEEAFLDPIFKSIGLDLKQGRFNEKRLNTYEQLWISQQILLGNHPTRAEAKDHVAKFLYANTLMGFWTSLYPRDVSPELVRLYQIVQGLHDQTLDFRDLSEEEQSAYRAFQKREWNPVAFNAYIAAVPKIEAYHAMEDFDSAQAYMEENPEIIPYVAPAYSGGSLVKRRGYKKQIDLMVQGENAHQVTELLDAAHLTFHQEQMIRAIFVTPDLKKFWAENDTSKEIRTSMERGAVFAYLQTMREQYFSIPKDDFKAKNEYMRQNPILEVEFQKNNMRFDDLQDPFNAAARDYRDTYFAYMDRDDFNGAAAFLKEHPWIFKFTKSEDSVTDDGIFVSKKFSAQRRKDYLAAYPYLQHFFKLRGDAKVGTKAGYAWLNSNAPGAKLVRDYFAKYGDFNGTKAQHARDYVAVKKYLVWFFDTLPEEGPFRGYESKWEWMQESDDKAAVKIRLYLRKYSKKGGSTEHSRDYLKVKGDLQRYFDLRKTDEAAAQAWLHSGTPQAEAVRAYFKKYGKMAKLSRQFNTWVRSQNPEVDRRNLFWKRYFDLEPSARPAFVHKNAEEYGVFIYGPIGVQERADAEQHYLRMAKAKHLSAKVALRLRIAPLLDTYFGLTDPTEKRLFERANPDMMSWLDKYGEGPMTGDKALDKKIGAYFDMEPDSNQRAEYLRNNPDVQDYFDLKNPADKAIHNTLEVYFAIEDPKKRKNYLIFHPEINNYFDRKKMEKQNLSDLTIAFDEADPRLEEYRLRMQSEIIDPAAVLYDTMRSQVASNIAGNDIVDPRSGLDPKEQKRRRRKKGVTLGP